jgi:hypothetical protein
MWWTIVVAIIVAWLIWEMWYVSGVRRILKYLLYFAIISLLIVTVSSIAMYLDIERKCGKTLDNKLIIIVYFLLILTFAIIQYIAIKFALGHNNNEKALNLTKKMLLFEILTSPFIFLFSILLIGIFSKLGLIVNSKFL